MHFDVCFQIFVFVCCCYCCCCFFLKADEVERKNVFKVHHKNMRVHFFQAQNEDSVNRYIIGSTVNEMFQLSYQSCQPLEI